MRTFIIADLLGRIAPSLAVLAVVSASATSASADEQGPTPATARAYARLLERFDANRDGLLQTSELSPRALRWLGPADTDRDGVITPAELHAFGVARRAARFARADHNGDGKLDPAEVGAAKWEQLKVADANGDGAVTLAEIEQAVASGLLHGPSEEVTEHAE
jgi:Ca2+-binding EF-hand superfamily protein